MDLQPFTDFLLVRDKNTKVPETVRNYVEALRRLEREHGFNLEQFVASTEAAEREGTRVLGQLRARGANAYNLGQKALNALARFANHKGLRWEKAKTNETQPRPFTEWELDRLLQYRSKRSGWAGKEETSRRRALLWFAIFTAMRHGEIHRARTGHLDDLANRYTVGKPSKLGAIRTLPVEPEFYSSGRPLHAWLHHQRPVIQRDPTIIWTTTIGRTNKKGNRTRQVPPRPLSYAEIGKEFKQMGKAVGVDVNFYRTRATRATVRTKAGDGIRTIQAILGHTKAETTVRYVRWLGIDVEQEFRRNKAPSPIKKKRRKKEPEE